MGGPVTGSGAMARMTRARRRRKARKTVPGRAARRTARGRMRQVAAASALALGAGLLAACAAGQSAYGGCTAPVGAAGAAGAAAGTDATGRKGPLRLTGDHAPPQGG